MRYGCKVWNFNKPTPDATTASTRVASWLAALLGVPLVWNHEARQTPEDDLIIVNGSYAFCGNLPDLAVAVRHARRIAWVQQDYTIVIPKVTSKGRSPFRAAFRLRHKAGKEPVRVWTTCLPLVDTAHDRYVNWNSLFYAPLAPKVRADLRRKASRSLLYYGSYRAGRVPYFDRYLSTRIPGVDLVISGSSKNFQRYAPVATVLATIKPRSNFQHFLASHGLGLYLEDRRSHTTYHSPSTRFYEMLSSGLPMIFQPEAAPMLKQHGKIDVAPYVVNTSTDVSRFLKHREDVGEEQRRKWGGPHLDDLHDAAKKVATEWRRA